MATANLGLPQKPKTMESRQFVMTNSNDKSCPGTREHHHDQCLGASFSTSLRESISDG